MGCGNSSQAVTKPIRKVDTVFGRLEIKVLEAVIEHQTSTVFSMDPYVNIKFSNQSFKGAVVKKGGKNPKFQDKATFYVNSQYKHYGRCLQIELMDSNVTSDDVIGYGIIDLDPYLNSLQMRKPQGGETNKSKQPPSTNLRCFLNCDRKQAGFVTLFASFFEEPTEIINFRFETAQLTRSTRTFGDMNCSVRVTVGEEVLQTKQSLDTNKAMPCWKQQFLTFACLPPIRDISIDVMDEDQIVGSLTIDKMDFLKETEQQSFNRQITHKGSIAGKLRFNTLNKSNPVFKELMGDYKKKTPEEKKKEEEENKDKDKKDQKDKDKEEKKEEKKKEEKKEEPKEEKKEEKKEEPKQQKKEEKKPE